MLICTHLYRLSIIYYTLNQGSHVSGRLPWCLFNSTLLPTTHRVNPLTYPSFRMPMWTHWSARLLECRSESIDLLVFEEAGVNGVRLSGLRPVVAVVMLYVPSLVRNLSDVVLSIKQKLPIFFIIVSSREPAKSNQWCAAVVIQTVHFFYVSHACITGKHTSVQRQTACADRKYKSLTCLVVVDYQAWSDWNPLVLYYFFASML